MKIAGLIPTNVPFLNPLKAFVDATIVLGDNCYPKYLDITQDGYVKVLESEVLNLSNQEQWNCYGNRLTLLARAAAHGCLWVMWSDSDWTFPMLTKDLVYAQITEAIENNCVGVSYRLREMWNETHYRSDGIWGEKRKVILQKNPLMERSVKWTEGHLVPLHNVPLQMGYIRSVDFDCLHWGMDTPEKRQARMEKHQKLDPMNKYQAFGYSYLCDETGIELKPI